MWNKAKDACERVLDDLRHVGVVKLHASPFSIEVALAGLVCLKRTLIKNGVCVGVDDHNSTLRHLFHHNVVCSVARFELTTTMHLTVGVFDKDSIADQNISWLQLGYRIYLEYAQGVVFQ